jgi:hypothetical protein
VQIYKPQDIYNVDIHPDFWSCSIHGVCKTNSQSQQVTEVKIPRVRNEMPPGGIKNAGKVQGASPAYRGLGSWWYYGDVATTCDVYLTMHVTMLWSRYSLFQCPE